MSLAVSIIIPAHNAAATLAETIASVQAQTLPAWEVIIVENGSTDGTASLAAELAVSDSRIRATTCPEKGVSRARNHGVELARHEWLLFLDADDWILPQFLATMTAILGSDPTLDAVHCGWRRVSPAGGVMFEEYGSDDVDLFPLLSRTCPFAIHACLVRRSRVTECGGFDASLRTCEDWDLWQRIARAGARFAACPEILAVYRARPQSASMDGRQMMADGLQVIARAFGPDLRVPQPLPCYERGLPPDTLPAARVDNLIWQAGLLLGAGHEANDIFTVIAGDPPVDVDPDAAASSLFEAVLLPTARMPDAWWRLLLWICPQLERFLAALEAHTQQRGLARTILSTLERRAIRSNSVPRPVTIGRVHGITLELAAPFTDLTLGPPVERLHCRVQLQGEFLGELELPVCDGFLPADVLADAVAAEFSWPILGRFFRQTLYPQLNVARAADGWTVRRGSTVLARALESVDQPGWETVHDAAGWPLFVQEAWGLAAVPEAAFYTLERAERRAETPGGLPADAEWLVVDLLDALPARRAVRPHVDLVLTVAGVPVARVPLIVPKRTLTAGTIRAALTIESGFELCRACVREALLQRPLETGGSLRDRLKDARARRLRAPAPAALDTAAGFMPGVEAVVPTSMRSHPDVIFWARHPHAPCGTSASRRTMLPRGAWNDLQRVASAAGGQLLAGPGPNGTAHTVLYAPELVWRPARERRPVGAGVPGTTSAAACDRRYFEELFASSADPWGYTSSYEQRKYEQTLQLIPPRRFHRALELACAEGHFTVQLAPRVGHLLATDISTHALDRARQRCAGLPHVDFQQLDLVADALPEGTFDLIVCSEVLYYTGSRASLEVVADKLASALAPGGCLVSAHALVRVDDATRPGFEWDTPFGAQTISTVFGEVPALQLAQELRTPLYRVQLYQRTPAWRRWLRPAPLVQDVAMATPLPPDVAEQVRWEPEPPVVTPEPGRLTDRLPILMYHRIATDGPTQLGRYRLAPEQFEVQLRYLQENNYTSATLEEWRAAAEIKRPLKGRRVLLTFDDGCVDFLTTAWPLLRKYGFGALVFLPTNEIGGHCRWDARHGDPAPVMDWADLRALQKEGVEFGSHTATHPMMTGLTLEELAREALRSRAEMEEQLGTAVTSIAYPFGATDRIVENVCGAAGYLFGLTCAHRLCETEDRLLALPRLEVSSTLTLDEFADMLTD